MPTPFEDWKRRYKTGQDPAGPGSPAPPRSATDQRINDAAGRFMGRVQGLGQDVATGAKVMGQGITSAAKDAVGQSGKIMSAVGQAGKAMSAAGRRAVAPLVAADAALGRSGAVAENAVQGFGADMREGAKTMGRGFAQAGRDIGNVLEKINRGPQGPTWATINSPGRPGPTPTPAAAADIPNRLMPAHGPVTPTTKERNPATAAAGGDPGKGVPKPGTGGTDPQATAPAAPQAPQGSRYLDMYNAGPEAQAKFLKDKNLIHMIRGTKQTYGNPNIQGDLGIREFKTPLEAAFGVDHDTAMAKHLVDTKAATELEKERIKAAPKREPYKVEKVTEYDANNMPQEVLKVFDPNTGKIVDDAQAQAQAIVDSLNTGQITEEEFKQHYANANDAQKKRIREIIAMFQNL